MLDYMTIALVLMFAVMGAMAGFLLQSLRLVAAGVAAWVALQYSPVIAESVNLFSEAGGMKEFAWPIIVFTGFYLVLALIAKMIAGGLRKSNAVLSAGDRILGAVAGALKGAILAYFIVSVALAAQSGSDRQMVALNADKSKVVGFVAGHPIGDFFNKSDSTKLKQVKISIQEAAADAAAKAESLAGKGAGAAAGAVMDAAKKAADQIGDSVNSARQKAADQIGDSVNSARQKAVDDAAQKIDQAGEAAGDKVRAATDSAKKAVED